AAERGRVVVDADVVRVGGCCQEGVRRVAESHSDLQDGCRLQRLRDRELETVVGDPILEAMRERIGRMGVLAEVERGLAVRRENLVAHGFPYRMRERAASGVNG